MLARARTLTALAFALLIVAGAAQAADERPAKVNDPLEPMNRAIYNLNKNFLDKYILIPIIKFHNRAIPRPARISIRNFFENLKEPVTAENDILQGSFGRAGQSLGRFGVNTTVGLVGLMDIADGLGWKRQDEDFGQTLGTYGVGQGPYLVLPVLGPSSVRDIAGRVADDFMDPFQFIQLRSKTYWTLGKDGATLVESRAHKVKKKLLAGQANNASYEASRARYLAEAQAEVENKDLDEDEGPGAGPPPANGASPIGGEAAPTSGAAPPANLHLASIPPQETTAAQGIMRQFSDMGLSVAKFKISDGQLDIGVKPAGVNNLLSCGRIWNAVNFDQLSGVNTVNVSTVDEATSFGCTKFLDNGVNIPAPSSSDAEPGLPGSATGPPGM